MKTIPVLSWLLRLLAALIMLQTLYFKFTASEESVYIFSTLGMEPWGRIATGMAELAASVLLLIPSTVVLGAISAIGIMFGAMTAHLTMLGIEVKGDGGYLFVLCLVVFLCALILLFLYREQLSRYTGLIGIKQSKRVIS